MKNGSSWIDMLAFRVENEWGDPAGGGRNEEAVAGQDGGEREQGDFSIYIQDWRSKAGALLNPG